MERRERVSYASYFVWAHLLDLAFENKPGSQWRMRGGSEAYFRWQINLQINVETQGVCQTTDGADWCQQAPKAWGGRGFSDGRGHQPVHSWDKRADQGRVCAKNKRGWLHILCFTNYFIASDLTTTSMQVLVPASTVSGSTGKGLARWFIIKTKASVNAKYCKELFFLPSLSFGSTKWSSLRRNLAQRRNWMNWARSLRFAISTRVMLAKANLNY